MIFLISLYNFTFIIQYIFKQTMAELTYDKFPFLAQLGIEKQNLGAYYNGKWQASGQLILKSINPTTQQLISTTRSASIEDYEQAVKGMVEAKAQWAKVPMPKRGQIVRQIGQALRQNKEALGLVVSLQMGKIKSQGLGQVQQTIDICDMACGLSRSIGGSIFNSQRPDHFMMQIWNPLGIVGVITAFNFPNAVFGWNAAIALICGNVVTWKGSPQSSLTTIATAKVIASVLQKNKINPNVFTVVQGDVEIGARMVDDKRIPLISFTGSTKVGKIIQQKVNDRFGKVLLQLGGNNATIIMDDADLQMAFKACTFAAVGTCGQRCTSLRRLLIHEKVYDAFVQKLVKAYSTVKIGDPLDGQTLCGPLNSTLGLSVYENAIKRVHTEGGKILCGGKRIQRKGYFVQPTIVAVESNSPIIKQEYFCPIMFVMKFSSLEQAIQINNSVAQGLSSSLFTKNISNAFKWIGPLGSDCGIVNVNIGNSGAQIGGAFGGQKQTGGGRQSGSDSWKQYMRRSTCTINYGNTMPLAQGVNFDL